MMSVPTIDRATFDALSDATGADFARELVDTFLEEAPAMLNDLRDALATNDADRFRRAAHSLKSNSLTFGALTLGAMARELELTDVTKVRESAAQPLAALSDEYARVATALTDLRHA
jgi:HPt (histidine-containing phosphotransfer) domain-containing protein